VLAALLIASCGDPLVDETYRGEPLITLHGAVMEVGQPGLIHRDDLRAALFWSPGGLAVEDVDELVEQPLANAGLGMPPSLQLPVFDPPSAEHLAVVQGDGDAPSGEGVLLGLGLLLAYPDENGNGMRDPEEQVLGGVRSHGVLYAPAAVPAEQSPTAAALPAGFAVVQLPLPCGAGPAAGEQANDATCDVALGEACATDAQCGEDGVCLLEVPMPWPEGACAVADPAPTGCPPAGAVFMPFPAAPRGAPRAYWIRPCDHDDDCPRGAPYGCDLGAGACLPEVPLRLGMDPAFEPRTFCHEPLSGPPEDPPDGPPDGPPGGPPDGPPQDPAGA